MSKHTMSYEKFAEQLRGEGDFEAAGDYYTAGAYNRLRSYRWSPEYVIEHSPQYPNVSNLGGGCKNYFLQHYVTDLTGSAAVQRTGHSRESSSLRTYSSTKTSFKAIPDRDGVMKQLLTSS